MRDEEIPSEKNRDLDFDVDHQDWYLQPATGNHWVVAYNNVFLVDRAGNFLKIIDHCPDRRWLHSPHAASVGPDGSLAVVARNAVNLYSAAGGPIRTVPIPDSYRGYGSRLAYNGRWVAFVDYKKIVVLLDSSTQKWQQFSPVEPSRDQHWHPLFAPDGRELLLFDGLNKIFRYELPRATESAHANGAFK